MKVTVLKRPKLIAVIKTSGIKNFVEWIDLKSRRCKTTGGYESDIDDFEFIDSRDYDELRGEYAGRPMQASSLATIRVARRCISPSAHSPLHR